MSRVVIGGALKTIRSIARSFRKRVSDEIVLSAVGAIGRPFDIDPTVDFRSPKQIAIARECIIKAHTILNGRSSSKLNGINMGPCTYVKEGCYFDSYDGFIEIAGRCAFGQRTMIHGGGGVTIGSHVIVGPNCCIIASNHEYRNYELPIMLQGDYTKGIVIGDNVWLGCGTIVLDGVVIGNNCIVGAGTVISKSIPANRLVYNQRTNILKEVPYAQDN